MTRRGTNAMNINIPMILTRVCRCDARTVNRHRCVPSEGKFHARIQFFTPAKNFVVYVYDDAIDDRAVSFGLVPRGTTRPLRLF